MNYPKLFQSPLKSLLIACNKHNYGVAETLCHSNTGYMQPMKVYRLLGEIFQVPKWLLLLNLTCSGHCLFSVAPAAICDDQPKHWATEPPASVHPIARSGKTALSWQGWRPGCSFHKLTALFPRSCSDSSREGSCLQHRHVNTMAINWNQIADRAAWPASAVVCGTSACWVSFLCQ